MADIYLKDKNGSKVPYYNVNSVSFDGLAEGTQEVFVASGSQTKVQSDWYENDATADSYVKNRPGGYYTIIESKTYTFDGDVTGKETISVTEGETLVKITNDSVLNSQINTITSLNISNDGVAQTATTTSGYESGMQMLIATDDDLAAKLISPVILVINIEQGKGESAGIPDGLWFVLYTKTKDQADTKVYPTSITTTTINVTQTIPQEFLSVKQSDWSAYPNSITDLTDGYIKNRLGGFIDSSGGETELTFDGIVEGKEHYQMTENVTIVKALDFPLTKSQMSSIRLDSISVVAGGTTYSAKNKSIKLDDDFMGYILSVTITAGSGDETTPYLVSCPVGTIIPDTGAIIPPGTYFIFLNDGSATSYLSAATVSTTIINKLPSEFIDNDFGSAYLFANGIIIPSSTSGSTKKYRITVNDEGVISAVLYSS